MSELTRKYGDVHDFDPYRMFIANMPLYVSMARHAAQNIAYSYRGFKVGVTVQGHQMETGQIATMSYGNLKIRDSEDKICAEKTALELLEKTGMTEATGLVVVATTNREEIAGVNDGLGTPTLHPCSVCRGDICIHHKLMRPDTLIATAGLEDKPSDNIYQAFTNKELVSDYYDANHDRLLSNVRTFDHWKERLVRYDHLVVAERAWPGKKPRSTAVLARMALNTDLAA